MLLVVLALLIAGNAYYRNKQVEKKHEFIVEEMHELTEEEMRNLRFESVQIKRDKEKRVAYEEKFNVWLQRMNELMDQLHPPKVVSHTSCWMKCIPRKLLDRMYPPKVFVLGTAAIAEIYRNIQENNDVLNEFINS